jgi:hypothetical protein
MAFLHDLIFHLSPQQQLQLSELDLRPVEKNVIEFIMAQKKDSFPSALALKRLNLTQSHF